MHLGKNTAIFCLVFIFALMPVAVITGCSSGKNPTSPALDKSDLPGCADSKFQTGELGLGVFDLIISPDLTKAEIVPDRDMFAYGDSWSVEISNFLRADPCRDCLQVIGIWLNFDNQVVLRIKCGHPFNPGNQSLPPSAKNRDDLRVFDTKLIVVDKGNFGPAFDAFGKRLSSNIVRYADGYTDMIDKVYDQLGNKPDDTHPYVILFRDANEGNVDPSSPTGFTDLNSATGHNIMNQGWTSFSDMTLDIKPGESHEIKLFLTASYGISAPNYTLRLTPRYYLPEYNAKEAWRVNVLDESDSLGPGYTESMAEVLVKVWDWQHGATVDPSLSSLDKIRAASDVASVDITCPGLFNGIVSDVKPDPGGTGKGDTPLEYRLGIYNELGAPSGTYPALVRVVDDRQIGGNVSIPEDGVWNSGFGLIPFDVPGFRTYQYIEFTIVDFWNVHPVARFELHPDGDPLIIGKDESFNFDASSSYDVDGGINTYEWDFDYDRQTFSPEPGYTSYTGTWKYSNPGTYRIAVRVKDNTIPMMTDITYKYVVVTQYPQTLPPRLICPAGNNCNNLQYSASKTIKIDEGNVYVAVGGYPYGERYIIKSADFGANFSAPVKVPKYLNESSTQHIGGIDISSTGEIGYAYFDENTTDQNGWLKLNRSTDGVNWDNEETLVLSTQQDYVNNSELLYGASDRMFLIFNMLNKSTPPVKSGIRYLHRLTPQNQFQVSPLPIATSSLPVSEVEFHNPHATVGDDGQIHVVYIVRIFIATNERLSANYARLAADGSAVTKGPIKINPTGTLDAQPDLDIATDGQKIYVAFMQWDTLSQVLDLVLVASEDNGETWWSTPVTITDWQIQGSILLDHPVCMTVDQNHRINVVWADDRMAGTTLKRDIWFDYSDDGGHTFHTDRRIYGDGVDGDQGYPSMAIDDLNRIHVVWWNYDTTVGAGVWHTRFIN